MARYRGPVGKVSRRLGIGISEKGQRILNKRAFPPGQHGPSARRRQISEYGLQLQEKQKARYMYGVLEGQFHRIFENCCKERDLPFERGLVEHLLQNYYAPRKIALRGCQPRDLIDQVLSLAEYRGEPRVITPELLDAACAGYFVDERESTVVYA